MKKLIITLLLLISITSGYSQGRRNQFPDTKYLKLIPGSEKSEFKRVELFSDIDTSWNKWKLRGYNYGFDPKLTPMYSMVNGILSTPYMVQVRGNENEKNKKRWGYHVFEGYAKDDISRITMLVNKHTEEEKPLAEMYYYGSVYGHSEAAYNWFRIGSDVRQHSYMFSRDKAIFYGSLKLTNALTLGNIGKDNISVEKPKGDDETNYIQDAKHVNFKELNSAGNGTIFYDKDNHIVVIKINGEWMKLAVEPLPDSIKYEFK
jgi:hypothetical protein